MHQYTTETLKPVCLAIFDALREQVPAGIATNLQSNRVVQPHGTNRNVLLWRVWDRRLPKLGYDQRYACLCLNYDPTHFYNRRSTWVLHLYFNTHRVYRHADDVRTLMMRRLPEICPPDFEFSAKERTVQIGWYFDFVGPVEKLGQKVLPNLTAATLALAPVYDELVSLVARPASEMERQIAISSRPRPKTRGTSVVQWENGPIFSHAISPALRAKIIRKYNGLCALCQKPLGTDVHIDHIVPWSKGGLTVETNLQPAHGACNLAKVIVPDPSLCGVSTELVANMNVSVVFKDVTWESLNDPKFIETAKNAMPTLESLFEEFEAVKSKSAETPPPA